MGVSVLTALYEPGHIVTVIQEVSDSLCVCVCVCVSVCEPLSRHILCDLHAVKYTVASACFTHTT